MAPFEIYGLKIHRLLNFNMLFQFLLSKLSTSELFSCLQRVDHVATIAYECLVFPRIKVAPTS